MSCRNWYKVGSIKIAYTDEELSWLEMKEMNFITKCLFLAMLVVSYVSCVEEQVENMGNMVPEEAEGLVVLGKAVSDTNCSYFMTETLLFCLKQLKCWKVSSFPSLRSFYNIYENFYSDLRLKTQATEAIDVPQRRMIVDSASRRIFDTAIRRLAEQAVKDSMKEF